MGMLPLYPIIHSSCSPVDCFTQVFMSIHKHKLLSKLFWNMLQTSNLKSMNIRILNVFVEKYLQIILYSYFSHNVAVSLELVVVLLKSERIKQLTYLVHFFAKYSRTQAMFVECLKVICMTESVW